MTFLKMNLKDILVQYIKTNLKKYGHPTVTLFTTFQNTTGVEKPYVRFLYAPQTILSQTQGHFLVSKDSNTMNTYKQVNNQW